MLPVIIIAAFAARTVVLVQVSGGDWSKLVLPLGLSGLAGFVAWSFGRNLRDHDRRQEALEERIDELDTLARSQALTITELSIRLTAAEERLDELDRAVFVPRTHVTTLCPA